MSRRAENKARIRAALVEAARGLFDEVGFDHARTSEIAERAGVGEATLFRYFPTKADLALAPIKVRICTLVEQIYEIPPEVAPYDAVVQAAGTDSANPFLGSDIRPDMMRIAKTPELAGRLYFLLGDTKWQLVADFAQRMGLERMDPRPRLAADVVIVSAMYSMEQSILLDNHDDALESFFEALAAGRGVLDNYPASRAEPAGADVAPSRS